MSKPAIIGIDSGNIYTGWCVIDEDYKPIAFGKTENNELFEYLEMNRKWLPRTVYIEKICSYGNVIGQSTIDTIEWIGRQHQFFDERGHKINFVKRKTYVTEFCGNSRAKDANIKQYLVDRFAPNTPNHGKGNKKEPGFFYGMSQDAWSAFAIATYGLDVETGKVK